MPVAIDDYKAGLSARLIAECPTLEDFRARWVNPPDREEMIAADRRRGLLAERAADGRAHGRLRPVRRAGRSCAMVWRRGRATAARWRSATSTRRGWRGCRRRPPAPSRRSRISSPSAAPKGWRTRSSGKRPRSSLLAGFRRSLQQANRGRCCARLKRGCSQREQRSALRRKSGQLGALAIFWSDITKSSIPVTERAVRRRLSGWSTLSRTVAAVLVH